MSKRFRLVLKSKVLNIVLSLTLGFQTFYQFVASNRGAELVEILSLGGQPTPQLWEHYDNWWLNSRQQWIDSEKLTENAPDWALRVMWKSKSFMACYWNLVNQLVTNPFQLTLEQILWSTQHLAQVNILRERFSQMIVL